jgi:DNA-directed RNA polymerase specialized sigma24 family protein
MRRILEQVQAPVFRFLAARVRSYPDADDLAWDLVQETLIRVLRHAGRCTFDSDARVVAWALAVARSVLLDHLRRRRAPVDGGEAAGLLDSLAVETWVVAERGGGPGTGVVLRVVDEAWAALPAATAELIRLRVELRATWKEVGGVLGTTESGAKRRFQRACARLRGDILRRLDALPGVEQRGVRHTECLTQESA